MKKEFEILSLLIDLEMSLRTINCWDLQGSPSDEALQSQEPFAVDFMGFNQWLQWIFIPRIRSIIAEGENLPDKCSISPMAEEWIKLKSIEGFELILILEKIDKLLSF